MLRNRFEYVCQGDFCGRLSARAVPGAARAFVKNWQPIQMLPPCPHMHHSSVPIAMRPIWSTTVTANRRRSATMSSAPRRPKSETVIIGYRTLQITHRFDALQNRALWELAAQCWVLSSSRRSSSRQQVGPENCDEPLRFDLCGGTILRGHTPDIDSGAGDYFFVLCYECACVGSAWDSRRQFAT